MARAASSDKIEPLEKAFAYFWGHAAGSNEELEAVEAQVRAAKLSRPDIRRLRQRLPTLPAGSPMAGRISRLDFMLESLIEL